MGALSQGVTGIVGFTVDNTGSGPAAQVTAHVTLPAGVSLLAAGILGRASMDRASPGGWTCAPTASGATCTHGPLAADAAAASYLQVLVAADARPAIRPPSRWRAAAAGRPRAARPEYQPADSRPGSPRLAGTP